MSRIAYNKKWQFKLFVPVLRGKYPPTQDVHSNDCLRSRPCAVWFVRLSLRGILISWIALAIAVKRTLADIEACFIREMWFVDCSWLFWQLYREFQVGRGLSFALQVDDKIFVVLIFVNGS